MHNNTPQQQSAICHLPSANCNLPTAICHLQSAICFISGIDTDTGKTIVTGLLARSLRARGVNVITQKFIQTGCEGISEDILKHREIMGTGVLEVDREGTTCPYVMSYPASPHLAAEIDGVELDLLRIERATRQLQQQFDLVLLEGAGGLYVPVTRNYYTLDYIREHQYPLILVSSSKLGSINHTLLSLEICRQQGIEVALLVYNHFPADSELITTDSITIFKDWLSTYSPKTGFLEVPVITGNEYPDLDVNITLQP